MFDDDDYLICLLLYELEMEQTRDERLQCERGKESEIELVFAATKFKHKLNKKHLL